MTAVTSARVGRRVKVSNEGLKQGGGSVALALVALVAWQIASGLTFVIPAPWETAQALFTNLGDARYRE